MKTLIKHTPKKEHKDAINNRLQAAWIANDKLSEAEALRLEFAEIAEDLRKTQLNKQGAICAILHDTLRNKYQQHKQAIKGFILWKLEAGEARA